MDQGERTEGVWIGNQDFGSRRWVAIALVLFLLVGAGGSALMALRAEAPIGSAGVCLFMLSLMAMFLPPALLGRGRSPGIRLVGLCVIVMGVALVVVSVAGRLEPDNFGEGARDSMMRAGAPFGAVFLLAVGGYVLWKSFKRITPTSHLARHAHRH